MTPWNDLPTITSLGGPSAPLPHLVYQAGHPPTAARHRCM